MPPLVHCHSCLEVRWRWNSGPPQHDGKKKDHLAKFHQVARIYPLTPARQRHGDCDGVCSRGRHAIRKGDAWTKPPLGTAPQRVAAWESIRPIDYHAVRSSAVIGGHLKVIQAYTASGQHETLEDPNHLAADIVDDFSFFLFHARPPDEKEPFLYPLYFRTFL